MLEIILVACDRSLCSRSNKTTFSPVLECALCHCPVQIGRPREIAYYPVVVFSMVEKVAPVGCLAPSRTAWQMTIKRTFPPARVETTTVGLKMLNFAWQTPGGCTPRLVEVELTSRTSVPAKVAPSESADPLIALIANRSHIVRQMRCKGAQRPGCVARIEHQNYVLSSRIRMVAEGRSAGHSYDECRIRIDPFAPPSG